MDEISQILENAREINRINHDIDQYFELMELHPECPDYKSTWSAACEEHRVKYDALAYPGGLASLKVLSTCDPGAIITAINYLEADLVCFRSGYIKEYIWRHLKGCPLTNEQLSRIRQIAMSYLGKRLTREFSSMGHTMKRLGDRDFWQGVVTITQAADERSERARMLLKIKDKRRPY